MEYVLSHLVAISMIGFTAVPFYYFETSLVVALKKLTMEWQADSVPNVLGESAEANPVESW